MTYKSEHLLGTYCMLFVWRIEWPWNLIALIHLLAVTFRVKGLSTFCLPFQIFSTLLCLALCPGRPSSWYNWVQPVPRSRLRTRSSLHHPKIFIHVTRTTAPMQQSSRRSKPPSLGSGDCSLLSSSSRGVVYSPLSSHLFVSRSFINSSQLSQYIGAHCPISVKL